MCWHFFIAQQQSGLHHPSGAARGVIPSVCPNSVSVTNLSHWVNPFPLITSTLKWPALRSGSVQHKAHCPKVSPRRKSLKPDYCQNLNHSSNKQVGHLVPVVLIDQTETTNQWNTWIKEVLRGFQRFPAVISPIAVKRWGGVVIQRGCGKGSKVCQDTILPEPLIQVRTNVFMMLSLFGSHATFSGRKDVILTIGELSWSVKEWNLMVKSQLDWWIDCKR